MQPFTSPYTDRREAGRLLAQSLLKYKDDPNVLVLGVSRGGAIVGAGIAEVLEVPLDIFCVRAVGIPGYEEVRMGNVARGVYLPYRNVIDHAGLSLQSFWIAAAAELETLAQQEAFYRDNRPARPIAGRTVILVDEGLTSESAVPVAVEALHRHGAGAVIVAVPVTTPEAQRQIAEQVNLFVCPHAIDVTSGLETWYADASEVDDESVREALQQAAERIETERHQEVT